MSTSTSDPPFPQFVAHWPTAAEGVVVTFAIGSVSPNDRDTPSPRDWHSPLTHSGTVGEVVILTVVLQ